MILFVVALPAEARPLVLHYGLRRRQGAKSAVWQGDDVMLAVTGVGQAAAAEGAELLAAFGEPRRETAWLNVGVAGHRLLAVGEVVLAHKVVEAASGRSWYPPLVFEPPCATATVVTVERPERDYPEDAVYEMEAAGFCAAAGHHSSAELIQVVKVISDNASAPVGALTAAGVELLVEARLETIVGIAAETAELAGALDDRRAPPVTLTGYLERWHFTVSQQRRLERLLRRLATVEAASPTAAELGQAASSRVVLARLEARLAAHPAGAG